MKLSLKILIALILFVGIEQVSAQSESGKNTSINLQLGLSAPFGLPANSSSIIPQLGLDFNFGKFGFRATEQFFKTSPEFDINEYLEPFGSDITQTGAKEKSSNFVMGIIPYLNLPLKDNFLLQPALGLKYLIQNGATNYVTYKPDPRISLLEYTDGDARRSSFIIEPGVRAVFGKASNSVRFFVEASYAFAVGSNEITYSYLDLTDILTPGGAIDPDLLGSAPIITGTEKIMSNAFSPWYWFGTEHYFFPFFNKP